jgi:hypothetical protein
MLCETCNDTGFIETESLVLGRTYYDKELKELMISGYGKGDWAQTICPDCCDEG